MTEFKGAFAALAAIIAAAIVLHSPVLFFGEVYAPSGDIVYQNYPWRNFYASELKEGRLALWYPDQACGFPLFAEGQTGMLYPPNLFLHSLFDVWTAISLFCLLHTILAGAGAYFLFRRLSASHSGAAIMSTVFMASGPLIAHLGHFNLVAVASLMPWLIAAGLDAARAAHLRGTSNAGLLKKIALVSIVSASMILAGHPQMTAISFIALILLLAAKLAVERRENRPKVLPFIAAPAAGFFLGAFIALPQVLSTLQLLGMSNRSDFTFADFLSYSYPPTMLATLLYPFAFGPANAWQSPDYRGPQGFVEYVSLVGVIPAVFALAGFIGILSRKTSKFALPIAHAYKAALAAYSAAAVALVLALGKYAGIYAIFWLVPGMSATRIPARFIIPAILMLCALAAISLDGAVFNAISARARRIASSALFLLCFLPLLSFHRAFNLTSPKESALPVPEIFKQMNAEDGAKRIFHTGEAPENYHDAEFSKPCYPSIAGLGSVGWAGELVLENFRDFYSAALASGDGPMAESRAAETAAWLNALPSSELPGATEPLRGYYLIHSVRKFESEPDIFGHIESHYPLFLDQIALVTENVAIESRGEVSEARLVSATARLQEYSINTDKSALFVRTATNYPGWKAYLDGNRVRIIEANGAFQAVLIPPGGHALEFKFEEKFEDKVAVWFLIAGMLLSAVFLFPSAADNPKPAK